jgi:opacity protein-like surface antigen
MKRTAVSILALFFLLSAAPAAFAKAGTSGSLNAGGMHDLEWDGAFSFATGPGSFDAGPGFNFGVGYTLSQVDKNLQARLDVSFYDFSYNYGFFDYDLHYTRVPFTVSGRYYFPITSRFKAFAQAGLETSFDSFDYVDGFGNKRSKNEVNLGVTPGGGVEFFINRNASIFAVGRWHLIKDDYFSMHFGAAYHF